ncbi:MAG: hypothetical protein JO307_20035 [Bryobacterales bacterium]|nr:hypothetical protein [Bryobacterales bacterium]MBV9400372.1 hypothetical protein [Bryobacterales bacterium]
MWNYSYNWFDIADFYTGQIDFGDTGFVWRMQADFQGPKVLVWQADLSPSWHDHANWLDDNEDSQQGSTLAETYFQAEANHNYLVQVEFDASVNADSGDFGAAWCGVYFECTVPMVVFGSRFLAWRRDVGARLRSDPRLMRPPDRVPPSRWGCAGRSDL